MTVRATSKEFVQYSSGYYRCYVYYYGTWRLWSYKFPNFSICNSLPTHLFL